MPAANPPMLSSLPTTVCEGRDLLFAYLKFLSAFAMEVDLSALQESFMTRSFSAGTLMAVGSAFVLGPVVLGNDWIMRVLWICAALVGAVGTSIMLVGWGQGYASLVANTAGLDPEGRCIFAILNVVVGALVAASLATKVVRVAIFSVGAAAAGYAANILVPAYLKPYVAKEFPEVELQEWHTYALIGVLALLGGYAFITLAFAVVDLVLGAIGAYLVADGALQLALAAELLPPDVEATLQMRSYLRYYVLGLAGTIFLVRSRLVERPSGGGRSGYSELIGK